MPVAASSDAPSLDDVVAALDRGEGFATVTHRGRELVVMSSERFGEWEDAVDSGRLAAAAAHPDPAPVGVDVLRARLGVPRKGSPIA